MLIKSSSPDELPDCSSHSSKPLVITPAKPTPNHTLHLSNLDDQPFLRFSIKYLYLFKKSVDADALKRSLALALVAYYPLAGRLRVCSSNDHKLEVDCNGDGAVFVEASMESTADEVLEIVNKKPNKSWRKLLHRVDGATSFIDIPPLVVQVTYLKCGGMILSTAINHCLCDGIGTSQFLHAWAYLAANQDAVLDPYPFHSRRALSPRNPPRVEFDHLAYYNRTCESDCGYNLSKWLHSQPLVPSSLVFTAEDILQLKKRCSPSIKCTAFEVLASHTWRCWVESLALPMSLNVKLLFSINVRQKMADDIPKGYYGNAFVLGSAATTVKELVMNSNLHQGVSLVQAAKTAASSGECVKSLIDLLEDHERVKTDLRGSLVISQWSKLGLEELDFGGGKCMHMGALASDVCCLFLPVVGQKDSIRVLVSMPESVVEKFEDSMKGSFLAKKEDSKSGKNCWMDEYF
ncbi:unnamed protein product [Rhodiola kirilowii]